MRAKSRKRDVIAISSIALALRPAQNAAPRIAPALVPATRSMGIFSSSSTLSTPMWATARANPPPKASPSLRRLGGGAREIVLCTRVNAPLRVRTRRERESFIVGDGFLQRLALALGAGWLSDS